MNVCGYVSGGDMDVVVHVRCDVGRVMCDVYEWCIVGGLAWCVNVCGYVCGGDMDVGCICGGVCV